MKAKDTVLKPNEVDMRLMEGQTTWGIVKAQAEISFKAGYDQGYLDVNDGFGEGRYRAGRKEVVDGVKSILRSHTECSWKVFLEEWQAKLKEWDISL